MRSFEPAWDVDRVHRTICEIAETIPDRLPGTDAARRMAEFSRTELTRIGIPASVLPVQALVSIPHPAVLKVELPVRCEIPALTMAHSPSTSAPVNGGLVDVGLGAWDDYEGLDVAGKVTLSELSYAPPRQEKQRIASVRGSSAQIMMNWGFPDSDELPMGSVKSGWGNPTRFELPLAEAGLPCLGVSRRSGLMLRRLCADGPVRVQVETRADTGWRPIHLTVGEIAGGGSEDFVLVGGHQDGWFGAAATDNAAGSAIIIELARAFVANAGDLRRGLVFGFWAGHETGTMAGSAWWADRNWDRLRDHAVAYLQIDQPACTGTSGWSVTSNHELRPLAAHIHAEFGGSGTLEWAPQVKNGDSSFFGVGVPMMVAHSHFPRDVLNRTANAAYGWWHHTHRNDVDKVDKALIRRHLEIYGAYLWNLTMRPVLPMRFAGLAQAIESRVKELRSSTGEATLDLDALLAAATRLKIGAEQLDGASDRLDGSGTRDDASLSNFNDALKRISRALVPVVSTVAGKYGHDPYGLTEQTTLLPALYHVDRLDCVNDVAEREMRWVELRRARNRIADAVDEAARLAESSVRQL